MKTYEYRKMRGICVRCGKEPALDGRTRCVECSLKEAEYAEKYKKTHPNRRTAEQNAKRKEQRAERVQNGICAECGKHKAWNGTKLCMDCCLKKRRVAKRWRERHPREKEEPVKKLERLRAHAEWMGGLAREKNRERMNRYWALVRAERAARMGGVCTTTAATSGNAGSESIGGG